MKKKKRKERKMKGEGETADIYTCSGPSRNHSMPRFLHISKAILPSSVEVSLAVSRGARGHTASWLSRGEA